VPSGRFRVPLPSDARSMRIAGGAAVRSLRAAGLEALGRAEVKNQQNATGSGAWTRTRTTDSKGLWAADYPTPDRTEHIRHSPMRRSHVKDTGRTYPALTVHGRRGGGHPALDPPVEPSAAQYVYPQATVVVLTDVRTRRLRVVPLQYRTAELVRPRPGEV
jgi:hypothetical protein